MPHIDFRIVLENDVALSQSSASVSGGRTLKYVPGAALLGAVARHYEELEPEMAFELFHSGRVRFGNAFLEAEGSRALPVPLCFHRRKKNPNGPVLNLAADKRPQKQQLVQVRDGYFTRGGLLASVGTSYTMRTSVEEKGRAREGFLFGMEALRAGQAFRARISADRDAALEQVQRLLVGQTIRLGRSRSAEFGKAKIEAVGPELQWDVSDGKAERVVILCVSDLALRDAETGAPRFEPKGADFGMAGVQLDLEHSFLCFRRYSPFNGYRRRPDLERQVIGAGSVLVFQGAEVDVTDVRKQVSPGVGDYVRDGLGEVLIQPKFLENKTLDLGALGADEARPTRPEGPPPDELGSWLKARLAQNETQREAWELSRAWAETMRRYRKVPPAQWGEVRSIAARCRVAGRPQAALASELREHLNEFADAEAGKGRPESKASKDQLQARGATASRWSEQRGECSAAKQLMALLEKAPADIAVPAMELLATRMVRLLRQREE